MHGGCAHCQLVGQNHGNTEASYDFCPLISKVTKMLSLWKKSTARSLLSKCPQAAANRQKILSKMLGFIDTFKEEMTRDPGVAQALGAILSRYWPDPYDTRAVLRIWAIYDSNIKPMQLAVETALKDGMHMMGYHECKKGSFEVFHSDDGQFDHRKREALKNHTQGWYWCCRPPHDLIIRNARGPFISPTGAWRDAAGTL